MKPFAFSSFNISLTAQTISISNDYRAFYFKVEEDLRSSTITQSAIDLQKRAKLTPSQGLHGQSGCGVGIGTLGRDGTSLSKQFPRFYEWAIKIVDEICVSAISS